MHNSSTVTKTLKLFVSYWLKEPKYSLGSLLLAPAYVLQFVISPLFIAKAIGELASGQSVSPSNIWLAGLSLAGGILLTYIACHKFEIYLNMRGITALHNSALRLLLRQEYGYFADNFAGSLVTRANRLAKAFELFTYVTFMEMLGLIASVVIALGVMIFYNPLLGSIITVLWLLSIGMVIYMTIKRMPLRRTAVAQDTAQIGELADIVTNAITVKTFAREAVEQARYQKTNLTRQKLFERSWQVATNNGVVINTACGLLQLTVLIGGIWAIERGDLTIATFLLFQVYILRVIDSILKAAMAVRHYEGAFGDAHEMVQLFDRTPTILDPVHPEPSRMTQGAITFEQVQFSYTSKQGESETTALLTDFSLVISPGERVGLVGPSGGGKTTLTKLLLRFADVQSGAICIDGQDIRNVKQDDLHTAISYVPQEPLLFHRSIKENIGYGSPDTAESAIISAAKQAHAHDFIKSLPNGYDTLVGERGVKLSGGQRQRVALARAMLKRAPIVVLDEATSALDSESEQYIQDSLWKLMEGKTAIVIAHRLSTIQKLDRIIVLDNGRIVEEGAHKELLARKGLYAKLWKHQSGGFIED